MGAAAETAKLRPLNSGAKVEKSGAAGGGGAVLRIVKFVLALCAIPACVGLTIGTRDHFVTIWSQLNFAVFGPGMMLKWFALGAIAFGVLACLLWRPIVVYVFGHELLHAFAAWLCLGKVSNLTASAKGGQVTTSKTNTFIRLAPYCVPIYVLFVAGIYLALNEWWRPLHEHILWLSFAVGFFYAFHIGFTLWSLRRDQPDLKADGWLFSLVIIYVANLAVFVVVIGFVCAGHPRGIWPALSHCAEGGWQHVIQIYQSLSATAHRIAQRT